MQKLCHWDWETGGGEVITMKSIIYNDDGWSSYMRYPAPMSPEDIIKVTVLPIANSGVNVYQFCSLGGHAVNYNSRFLPRVGEMMDEVNTMHVWRMRETLRYLESLGTDPLHIVSKACHDFGINCQFSLRMNDAHHTYLRPDGSYWFPELLSPWFASHNDALLPNGILDYAHPDTHEYRIQQITEILENYEVGGIDLDFTRFKPFFRQGDELSGMPKLTELIAHLRKLTGEYSKTLSARFEYDPESCTVSGLDVEKWITEGYLDQITLGGVGDQTPDATAQWWIERAHSSGCQVFPSMEGQLHWIPNPGGGGTGLVAGDGIVDGYGPPSIEYMRAVASRHYLDGADGVSLFNFTCADGPFALDAFTELHDPETIRLRDKQYVAALWPWDAQIYCNVPWISCFKLDADMDNAVHILRIGDDIQTAIKRGIAPACTLTLDLMGINRLDDIEVRVNDVPVEWNGYRYNHYDCGCWNDIVCFNVSGESLRLGDNIIELICKRNNQGFTGPIEVRKLVLDIAYPKFFAPGIGIS